MLLRLCGLQLSIHSACETSSGRARHLEAAAAESVCLVGRSMDQQAACRQPLSALHASLNCLCVTPQPPSGHQAKRRRRRRVFHKSCARLRGTDKWLPMTWRMSSIIAANNVRCTPALLGRFAVATDTTIDTQVSLSILSARVSEPLTRARLNLCAIQIS